MRLESLGYHFRRLRRELGKPLLLAGRGYRVRGYIPNQLTTDFRHETHLLAPLRRALAARPGAFMDVGVNTGQTLLKLLEIDPTRAYVGFEPQVACCFFIDQFIRDNRVADARVVCLALGQRDSMMPIYTTGQFDEMASLVERSTMRIDQPAQAQFIPVRAGDDVLREMGITDIGVLKVDVEGAEIEVFRGLRETIARNRPVCVFEVLPNFVGHDRVAIGADDATRNREVAAELFGFFRSLDYSIRQIDQRGEESAIDSFDLDTPSRFVGTDYVAYPAAL